jgi:hypothetical protein
MPRANFEFNFLAAVDPCRLVKKFLAGMAVTNNTARTGKIARLITGVELLRIIALYSE